MDKKAIRATVRAEAEKMAAATGTVGLDRLELCRRAGISAGSFAYIMGQNFTDFLEDLHVALGSPSKCQSGRVSGALRRRQFLDFGVEIAEQEGFLAVTSIKLAEKAGVSSSLVFNYFKGIDDLYAQVVARAIECDRPLVVAKAVALGLPCVATLSEEEKRKALAAVQ